MRSFLITCAVLSTASIAIAIAASGCSSASCDDTNSCGLTDIDGATADGQGGDGMTGGEGGGGDASRDADGGASDAPSDSIADRSDGFDGFTCDVAKTPKDDNCVLLGFLNTGVFVAPAPFGTAGAAGTAAAPVDTINTALTRLSPFTTAIVRSLRRSTS